MRSLVRKLAAAGFDTVVDLLDLQKSFIRAHLHEGDFACDFTMGNGHDTAFLSETVGAGGHVTAFDIQPEALASTSANLHKWGCPPNWQLFCASHHRAKEFIDRPIKAGMFNLGYMPGGDHSLTTMRSTTLPAIENALSMLDRDSILLVAVYPGHAEGTAEGEELQKYFSALSRFKMSIGIFRLLNSPASPYFMIAETK